jgi:hypothetical protein
MKTSMAGPLGGATGGAGSGHHLVDEDIDAGPPRGAVGSSDSGHHLAE